MPIHVSAGPGTLTLQTIDSTSAEYFKSMNNRYTAPRSNDFHNDALLVLAPIFQVRSWSLEIARINIVHFKSLTYHRVALCLCSE